MSLKDGDRSGETINMGREMSELRCRMVGWRGGEGGQWWRRAAVGVVGGGSGGGGLV